METIEVISFAAAAGFAFAVLITVTVIIGIRKEERYQSLMNKTAPGAMAQLARIVLGRYVRKEQAATMGRRLAEDPASTLERMTSSRS